MVGVPRSSGCRQCVKRRVKCDERQPGCAKCETYGKPCPGYDKGFKFIPGKPYRTKRKQQVSGDSSTSGKQSGSTSPNASSDSSGSGLLVLPREKLSSTLVSSDLNVLQSLNALIDDFSQPVPTTQNNVVSHWFGFLPSVYGRSQTLDATIKSFMAHHFGKVLHNDQMVAYARCSYGEALYRLRKSLQSPSESLSSHVFCAVVLLCMYELFTDTENPESWMKHAKGLGQLIKARGPDRYRNTLDISLLKTSRGLIVMHSMFAGEDCFLASEEWHQMMRQQYTPDMRKDLHEVIEEFFALFTYTPSLVHKLYRLKEMDVSSPEALQIISVALEQALQLQDKVGAWYKKFEKIAPQPVEAPSLKNDEMFPVVLTYSDMIYAIIFCGYYSYKVIIHEVLRTFSYPGLHAPMTIYFRDQICKSVEYCSIGVLGPYRLGFPLRVAIEVADPATKTWIIARLQEFSKIYAAASPENHAEMS
ncbi:hypothetical protein N7532_003762 [Penicillium argentinense]|uniref:Zn(2)-C6 fungal-type domain-containing protein n=1 Tax=Penicillium argentinense TaxID=1131581 RepID=A0A9W9FN83_9EURO|nr:uncharacterized protein N7532_003762 [Penicillium argentinense]KAJ5103233.1 hypothetical protein N7532_003762 [Penicillium argentinense]